MVSHFLETKNVKEERRRGEEEEEEEEEKNKRREGERKRKRYGTMTMSMELCIDLYGYMLWVVGCEKPNPKTNSCMEI